MESGTVSSPPFATRPPTQPTHTFTRTRTSGSLSLDDAGINKGFEASTVSPLPEEELLPVNLLKSMMPYRLRL